MIGSNSSVGRVLSAHRNLKPEIADIMRTDQFDFELPADRIALRPASPRDSARLMVVRPDADLRADEPMFEDRIVRDLPELLEPGDALVVNDTRVIPARLAGRKLGGTEPRIEATLTKRLDDSHWLALARPARRLSAGDTIRFGGEGRVYLLGQLDATVEAKGQGGEVTLAFSFHGPVLDQAIAEVGDMPLPPYIAGKRAPDARDREDYQTLFAAREGSVAAPTAGLHFTEEMRARLKARRIAIHQVTLHVGAGTFLPVTAEEIAQHRMQAEWGSVSAMTAAALNAVHARGGRIVAVGSTALRLVETATGSDGVIQPYSGETALFVTPGYRFRAIDAMLTNFHLPRSTLFMLVSALCGLDVMQRGYAHAIRSGYRFYSYGDACLLFPPRAPR